VAGKPVPWKGPIALQYHGDPVSFRNISIKELPDGGAAPPAPTITRLFNGQDLAGWTVVKGKGKGKKMKAKHDGWAVRGGAIVSSGPPSYLFSERDNFKNFHVRAEVKVNDRGNSGLFLRAQFGAGVPPGYEVQINATHRDAHKTGSLLPVGWNWKNIKGILVLNSPHKPNQWFTLEAICAGPTFTTVVNGRKMAEWTDPQHRHKQGHFALQQLTFDTEVQFRKIDVEELPD
jgi:hypothetical protein